MQHEKGGEAAAGFTAAADSAPGWPSGPPEPSSCAVVATPADSVSAGGVEGGDRKGG